MNHSSSSKSVKVSFQPAFMRTIAMLFLSLLTIILSGDAALAQSGYTGIFGGGPFYKNSANITEIENSGFTEAIVWSVEVSSTGDLNFNGEFPLTSGGVYVGDQYYPNFASDMSTLKLGTVKRVTFSIGSSNFGDWQDIKSLVNAQGTGPTSILYKDFQALKTAIPALDAIDFDDENSFDSASTISFGVMLGQLGYHVMPDAFDDSSYWTNVVSQINAQLPGTADGVHLQAYAGGSGNNPCVGWNFGAVPVFPGLWDLNDTPSQVQSTMSGWNAQCGITGGFMWLYDDFVGTGLAAQYASAINTAVSTSGFTLSGPKHHLSEPKLAGQCCNHHHRFERLHRHSDTDSFGASQGRASLDSRHRKQTHYCLQSQFHSCYGICDCDCDGHFGHDRANVAGQRGGERGTGQDRPRQASESCSAIQSERNLHRRYGLLDRRSRWWRVFLLVELAFNFARVQRNARHFRRAQ